MAENRGIAPPDMSTAVGQTRALLGDVEYTEYDPPQTGFGMYEKMSDLEIEGFLARSDNSPEGAMYFVYLQISGDAAFASRMIRDFDLQVDTTKRSGEFLAIADRWKSLWDASTEDIFEVFDIGNSGCGCVPELAPRPFCRRGCNGSRLF